MCPQSTLLQAAKIPSLILPSTSLPLFHAVELSSYNEDPVDPCMPDTL